MAHTGPGHSPSDTRSHARSRYGLAQEEPLSPLIASVRRFRSTQLQPTRSPPGCTGCEAWGMRSTLQRIPASDLSCTVGIAMLQLSPGPSTASLIGYDVVPRKSKTTTVIWPGRWVPRRGIPPASSTDGEGRRGRYIWAHAWWRPAARTGERQ